MKVDYKDILFDACAKVRDGGAFLVVDDNPMTIGWLQLGIVWTRPVCTVLVRQSRFTHKLLETNDRISVCVPAPGDMKEALAYCGTRSGRDGDKCSACGIRLLPSETEGAAKHIDGCPVWLEAHIVAVTELPTSDITDKAIVAHSYGANQATPDGDPHTVYFCEIDAAYRADA